MSIGFIYQEGQWAQEFPDLWSALMPLSVSRAGQQPFKLYNIYQLYLINPRLVFMRGPSSEREGRRGSPQQRGSIS